MAQRPSQTLRTQTVYERLVKIRGEEKAALLAWADLDRFEIVDVSTDDQKGWAAVGNVENRHPYGHWPPRPAETPGTSDRVVATRVYVNCQTINRLEKTLERVFADDTGFGQTGLRPPSAPKRPGAFRERLTCRASFLIDEDGRPQPDSFGYAPLIDFAKYLERHAASGSMRRVISEGLTKLDQYEGQLLESWHTAAESAGHLAPEEALRHHLVAVEDKTDDPHRYLAVWVRPGDEPPGQLPAFYRSDLLEAAAGPTTALLRDYLQGRPGDAPDRAADVRSPASVGFSLVEPSELPKSAWAGGHLPRFSQQVALGGLLDNRSRVKAVNGPPGTGKSTLLRDVYANVVAERASIMVEYDDPRSAFGEATAVPGIAHPWHLRRVDNRLTGFEMLVASSNNAAVQNVSTKLPALCEVAGLHQQDLSYFRSATRPGPGRRSAKAARPTPTSDHRAQEPRKRPGLLPDDDPAWGLGAAVLGRRDLVAHFGEIVGRYFAKTERGEHLLGQLHGGGTLAGWKAAQAQYRTAVTGLESRLNELEEQRGRHRGGRGVLRRLLHGSSRAVDLTEIQDPRRWGRWESEPELGTAWLDEDMQQLRVAVFVAAMAVHEQFARRAGEAMNDNLRLWLALQSGDIDQHQATSVTLPAWQAFFLLVPLVSTTFASIHRLLNNVPAGSLGWLIVDEAGQATPGSAVGGLQRFRRAIIVGDPLQLEPVVTLPHQLVEQLMENRSAPSELAPHRASVQQLADAVTPWGTRRGGAWVGLPLLAHNRCQDPMFSIANEMAYDGAMVQGRAGQEAAGLDLLGPSRWIDVPRPEGQHFYGGDADEVAQLLARLPWGTSTTLPKIAVISPFRQVARELSLRIERQILAAAPPGVGAREQTQLLDAVGVGTVHTFQGQEYDVVILVLGGGSSGARRWAATTPNLLNVAVTRAKDRLYVVGDYSAWAGVGHARLIADGLPKTPAETTAPPAA